MPWLVVSLVVRTLYSCDREEPKIFYRFRGNNVENFIYAIRRYRFNKIFAIRSLLI